MPAEFIHDFDSYCEKLKDKIEANNEIEKVKFAEYSLAIAFERNCDIITTEI